MELLAPAGNIENFYAAIDAGADAVYIGAPGINARNLSRDLLLEEIGAMIEYAHGLQKKVYLAANSLIVENELSQLIETLSLLEALAPDALIVQDLAIIHLVRENFPDLRLHASTLMTGHNSDSVDLFAAMGCERVVLARELTIKEIGSIIQRSSVEIEIFVHGAMCYSYSGLCLFSSFLGGKSGMRGRCVQPCRRGYTWQSRQGKKKQTKDRRQNSGGSYLFSMNDLEGFEAVPLLKAAGVASLKIEGRLRSANYVSKIVQAYRLVMDASDSDQKEALEQARILSEAAMARKSSAGYFFSPQPSEAIVPHHSGNMGVHLGSFSSVKFIGEKYIGKIRLKKELNVGDRLRIHIEATGERKSFTLQSMRVAGEQTEWCEAGGVVQMEMPEGQGGISKSKVELYKVDNKKEASNASRLTQGIRENKKKLVKIKNARLEDIQAIRQIECCTFVDPLDEYLPKKAKNKINKKGRPQGLNFEWWLKTDNHRHILEKISFSPDKLLLGINKAMVSQSAVIKRNLGKKSRNVIWALPPVVLENDLAKLRKQVHLLLRSGFKSFQISHLSQVALFGQERVHLSADYTLNLANSNALRFASQTGVEAAQLSIELDRDALSHLVQGYKESIRKQRENLKKQNKDTTLPRVRTGLTVYGAPPLFTSRLSAKHLQFDKTLKSPKGEGFVLKKTDAAAVAVPIRPFSLLPYLWELQEIGLDYIIIDISNMNYNEKDMTELSERIAGVGRFSKLPTFNYLGKLM